MKMNCLYQLYTKPITPHAVDMIKSPASFSKPKKIIDTIVLVTGIHERQIKGKARETEIVWARHLCIYFIYWYAQVPTLAGIGKLLNSNHSSVIYGRANVDILFKSYRQFREYYMEIEETLRDELGFTKNDFKED